MKKILLSLGMIVFVGAVVIGATGAFFSDTETSTGNTFTAGAIDLKIDNESYVTSTTTGQLVASLGTTWTLRDLTIERFFDFDDLKPGDMGEDTISLHVNNNDSWLCADVTLTSNDDNNLTEPEEEDGDHTGGVSEGDLADAVNFIWWADDGDNVLEGGENVLPSGPLGVLDIDQSMTIALSDSQGNIWGDPGALPGDSVRYVGKAWCFGEITQTPVEQDNEGKTGNNGPLSERGTGFTCDGENEDNQTQTDSMTADVAFRAVQSRNNGAFVCNASLNRSNLLGAITLNPDFTNDGAYVHEVMQINYARNVDGLVDFTLANADNPSEVYYEFHGPMGINLGGYFEWSYRDQSPALDPSEPEGYDEVLLNPIWASDDTIVSADTNILIKIKLTAPDLTTQTVTATHTVSEEDVRNADHNLLND